jgi:ectoine hydroxylase-related dioxygenase (phytanoyl-CoA dioxygenase family)
METTAAQFTVENPKPFANEPFSPEKIKEVLGVYNREGCVLIPDIFSAEEVAAFKTAIDRVYDDPRAQTTNTFSRFVAMRLFEWNNLFRDTLVREPIIGLMEALLGADCHLISNNVVRNEPGQAIDTYHVDERLSFPLPESVARFDSRMTMPTTILNVQMPMTDLEAIEYGPTQYVPDSHYSGRHPNDKFDPTWEGRKGVTIFCKAGDIYLQNGQVWHRGAPNISSRTRYLLQQSYGTRMIAQRFFPFLNYHMPEHVLEGAGERLLRVLGKHPPGPYG